MTQLDLFDLPEITRTLSDKDYALLLKLQGDENWPGRPCPRCDGPCHSNFTVPIYEEISFSVTSLRKWQETPAWISVCSNCYDELNRRK